LPSGVYTAVSLIPADSSSSLFNPLNFFHPHQAICIATAYSGDYCILPYSHLRLFSPLKPASCHSKVIAFVVVLATDFLHCFVLPITSPHSSDLRSPSLHSSVIFTDLHC
jgi:hypothetical protein